MRSGEVAHLAESCPEPRPATAEHDVLPCHPVTLQDVLRHVDLAMACMPGQGAQEPSYAKSEAGMAGRLGSARILTVGKDQRGQPDQRRRGLAEIAFEVARRGHRV